MSIQLTTDELNELFPGQMIENGDPCETDRTRKTNYDYSLDFDGIDQEFCRDEHCDDYQEQSFENFQHPACKNTELSEDEIDEYEKDFIEQLQREAFQEEWGEMIDEIEPVYGEHKNITVIDPTFISPIRMIYKSKFNEKRGHRRNRVKILVA